MARIGLALGLALAGGLVGAFLGPWASAFAGRMGAEIGFGLGGMLGGILFPGKMPPGPRLQDLQVTSASDGAPIPFGYGINRVAGQLIWSSGIQEHQFKSSSKKGGTQQQTTYFYTIDFAVAFGEGPGKISKIWFDSKLAYDSRAVFMPVISCVVQGGVASYFSHLNPTIGEQVTVAGTIPIGTDSGGHPSGGFDEVAGVIATGSLGGVPFFNMKNSTAVGQAQFGTAGATTTGGVTITKLSESGSLVTAKSTLFPEVGSQVLIIDIPASLHGNAYAGYFQVVSSTPTFFTYYNPSSPNLFTIGDDTGNVFCGYAVPAQPRYAPPVIYTGTEVQTADPTIQAAVGAATCSAFRPLIYCVWQGMPLADFGNRLPNVRALVTYEIGAPSQVAYGTFSQDVENDATKQGSTTIQFSVTPSQNGQLGIMAMSQAIANLSAGWVPIFGNNAGVAVKSFTDTSTDSESLGLGVGGVWGINLLMFNSAGQSLTAGISNIIILGNIVTVEATNSFVAGTHVTFSALPSGLSFLNGQTVQISTVTGSGFTAPFTHADVASFPTATGTATNLPYIQVQALQPPSAGNGTYPLTLPNVQPGNILYVAIFTGDNNAFGTITGITSTGGETFTIFNDPHNACACAAYTPSAAGGSETISVTIASNFNPSGILLVMELPALPNVGTPTLPQIVSDICTRTGLLTSDIDVTRLATLSPPQGYMIGRPSTGAAALRPLATAFFFDGVETGGKLTFIPRGAATQALTIPEADLGLFKDQHKVIETINQAQDLPREFQVMFIDPAIDYQQNHTRKRRSSRVVKTKNQVVYEVPMTIDSTTARQIAEKALFVSYLERKPFQVNLWRPLYLLYDPTDVINFTYEGQSFTGRVVKNSIGQDFTTELELVNENASSYTSIVQGNSGTFTPNPGKTLPVTVLFMLDTPLLTDSDANPNNGSGYYFAMSSFNPPHWPGGSLMQSADNVNFAQTDQSGILANFGFVGAASTAPINTVPALGILEGLVAGNLLRWSQDFTQNVWSKTATGGIALPTVTPNVTLAPDNTLTASQLSFPTVGAGQFATISQSVGAGAIGVPIPYSIWLKSTTGGNQTIILRCDNGTPQNDTPVTVTPQWQQFVIFATPTATGTISAYIYSTNSGAVSVYAWGAQVLTGQLTPGLYQYTQANPVQPYQKISPFDWDTVNQITVFLSEGNALASTSDLNVLNGANAILIGNEILQFANAVQNADGSFTLSRLLRGRRGTEVFCNSHAGAESMVILGSGGVVRHPVTMDQVNLSYYYRPVTFGGDVTAINSTQFTNTGRDLMPYAPCLLAGSRDGSNNLTLTWQRRTRIGGAWAENVGEVPLSESFESYDVDILNGAGTVVRTFADLPLPTVVYTAAQQIADFGSTQSAVTMNVYQNSALVGRGFKATGTV